MRFKPGLILKLCGALALIFVSVLVLRDSRPYHAGGEYFSLSQTRQLKNDSKPNSPVSLTQKSAANLDLAEETDSLAGKRIDGLPNVTEPRPLQLLVKYNFHLAHDGS